MNLGLVRCAKELPPGFEILPWDSKAHEPAALAAALLQPPDKSDKADIPSLRVTY